ncbi:MAG: S8 family serine peptidase [Myxococcales bacterium]|nr:S8 family serine peptidase [Myxococcales bacterium]
MRRTSWWWCGLFLAACAPERQPATLFEAPLGTSVVKDQWLVEFEEPPLGLGGLPSRLVRQHRVFADRLEETGLDFTLRSDFSRVWNGVGLTVSADELETVRRLPGVKAVFPVTKVELDEPSPAFWERTDPELFSSLAQTGVDIAQNSLGLTGAGIRVAIVDTGTNFAHPDLGGCFGAGCRVSFGADLVGDAFDPDTATTSQPVPDAFPNDCRGHGSHVSGIIMANGLVKGVAPGVTFGSYRVFGCGGSTTTELLVEAIERAVNDGARVINISLGNPASWPQFPTAVAASAARAMGVVVVSSQGNNGAAGGLYASSAPGTGDDVLAVGSIENNATNRLAFTISADATRVGYEPSDTAPPPPATGTVPISGMPMGNTLGCTALAAGSLMGRVALIPRGTCSFTVKAQNAQTAGAVAVLIANDSAGALFPIMVTGMTIPVVFISQADGALITSRLGAGVTLTWGSSISTPRAGGTVSAFSSLGPTAELTLKPDLLAPGGGIYSTWTSTQGSYTTLVGTSMASAHFTGIAALMLQAQPTLTAAEIGDVLRNTAQPLTAPSSTNLESPVRQGAGVARIELAATVRSRVTPSKLSLGESQGTAAFTRTLTFRNDGATELTFTPTHTPTLSVIGASFAPTFTAAGQASVTFSAATVAVPAGGSATVNAVITPNPMLPERSLYGGFLVFTAGSTVLRVPYLGFAGDYQSMTILNAPDAGPFLTRGAGPATPRLTDGGVFTLQSGDVPAFVIHLSHYSRTFELEALDAATGKPWGTWFSRSYVGKEYTVNSTQRVSWDGFSTVDKTRQLLPNGTYVVKISALKAQGDAGTPSDTETWLSPPITFNHP